MPILNSPDLTVPESVGDVDVCVTLDNSIESSFTIDFVTQLGTALGICLVVPPYLHHIALTYYGVIVAISRYKT